jgi:ectoine hydroxylase-related dioxygenase (phytanoyl-CoA dioxygenase family)
MHSVQTTPTRAPSPLPLTTRFELGPEITAEQQGFLDEHGFLIFSKVASADELAAMLADIERVEAEWLRENRRKVFGIPVVTGFDHEGNRMIQRLAFTSCFSPVIHDFVRDPRLAPIRSLIGDDTRVGDREKDGVVVNRYVNAPGSLRPRLGWHTDGLRDLFYLRMPKQMLNVGLHFNRVTAADGGLRLIPGTHTQGFWSTLTRKPYFVDHRPDPEELVIETEPGDVTVHDGRLWHRVAQSTRTGAASFRCSMYVPYLTDEYQPKSEASKTPLYHYLDTARNKVRNAITALR